MENQVNIGKKIVLFILIHIFAWVFVLAMEASSGMAARLTLGLTGAVAYILLIGKLFSDYTPNLHSVPKSGESIQIRRLLENLVDDSVNTEDDLHNFLQGAEELKSGMNQLVEITGDSQLQEFLRQLDDLLTRVASEPAILSAIKQKFKNELEEVEAKEGDPP